MADGVPTPSKARKTSLRLSPLAVECPGQRCSAKQGEWCARLEGRVGNGFDRFDLNIHSVRLGAWLRWINGVKDG